MDQIASSTAPSDSAKTRVPVYEIIVRDLIDYGVTDCFGLTSDDTLGLTAALDANGVRVWSARHESSVVMAADGYSSASGNVGLAIIGRGPAAANCMHGIMAADRSGASVLVIMGEAEPRNDPNALGPDFKAYEASNVFSAAGLKTFKIDHPYSARLVLKSALDAASLGHVVTLHVPLSIQNALVDISAVPVDAAPRPSRVAEPARPPAIRAAAEALLKAKRPLIIAGLGAFKAGARSEIERLADKTGALLATSLKGKDFFAGNPFNLGVLGSFSHSVARKYAEQADCVVSFGAGLNVWTTSRGTGLPADASIIQVDNVRSHAGRYYPADICLIGDAKVVAEQLSDAVPQPVAKEAPFRAPAVKEEIQNFRMSSDFQAQNTSRTLDARVLAMLLDEILPKNRNIIYDSGNFFLIASFLSVPGPSNFRITNDFASIGAGLGTAIGFSAARPDDLHVLFIGDGGFMMTASELETFARSGLPIVVFVLNDAAYGAEVHQSRAMALPDSISLFPDIDFAPLAEAWGFQCETVRTQDDVRALKAKMGDWSGQILIDCKINMEVASSFISEMMVDKKHAERRD